MLEACNRMMGAHLGNGIWDFLRGRKIKMHRYVTSRHWEERSRGYRWAREYRDAEWKKITGMREG